MNTRRDPDRLIHDFLMEGQTELADQVFDSVRAAVDRKHQRVVVGPWRTSLRNKFVPSGLAAAAAVVAIVVGTQLVGSPAPTPTAVQNGWIAFSTQPGLRQASETDWGAGGDIYLVREGVEPRVIVERGSDMNANVCPQFSPDGTKLVYGESDRGVRSLVVLEVRRDGYVTEWRRVQLAGASPVAPCPRWARNGTHLAYLDHEVVAVVDLDGNPAGPIASDPGYADFTDSETDDSWARPTAACARSMGRSAASWSARPTARPTARSDALLGTPSPPGHPTAPSYWSCPTGAGWRP